MLWTSFQLNDLQLSSRLVMAPMTRCAASEGHVPTPEMALYYGDRASVGLVIAEASAVSECAHAYPCGPGLYNGTQVERWREVTEAVHARGGKIFVQLWHSGMMSHSYFRQGDLPVAPSTIAPQKERLSRSGLVYETPRPMEEGDFTKITAYFVRAAKCAKEAGFDGVELHGAGGYLLDSFLHHHTNRRTDGYGEDKGRFVLEIVDAVVPIIRTGIRLSPTPLVGMENMLYDERDKAVFQTLFQQLEKRELAYVHLATDHDHHEEFGCVSQFVRQNYSGVLIGSGGYDIKRGEEGLMRGDFDLFSLGRLLLANPDLVERVQSGQPLHSFSYEMVDTPPRHKGAPFSSRSV